MINKPLVAIHCLVYNHEPYLRDCFEGFVMQQTNFPFVAVVHDDASTDGSAAIIREYEQKYPHIFKPIYESENQWSRQNGSLDRIMNDAIEATGAKYIAICEGDDYWIDTQKLQKQVDFMDKNGEYGLCYTDFSIYDEFEKKIIPSYFTGGLAKPTLTFEDHLFTQGFIGPMTWLFRKKIYDSFSGTMLKGYMEGSYILALEFFANSRVAYLPAITATYRKHFGSASRPNSLSKKFEYRKNVYNIEREYAKRYLHSRWFDVFILQQELTELYPLAIELNNREYVEWCHTMCFENPMIDVSLHKWIINLQQEITKIHQSYSYRIGKLILGPFAKIKKSLKK